MKTSNILMVDDEAEILQLIKLRLAREAPNFKIKTVRSGQECLEYIRIKPGEVDCILSDYQMPGMNGLELLEQLRSEGNHVPFIFITGQGNEKIARDAFKNGADDYFTKDIGFAYFPKIKKSIEQAIGIRTNEAEKLAAEEGLKVSEQKYKELAESTSDWLWETDFEGRYTYASPRIMDILGYEPQEVIGRKPFDLMPAEESEKIEKEFKAIAGECAPICSLENINLHKNGGKVVLETNAVPFFDEDGNLKGYRGIDRNITERKKAQGQLKKVTELLAAISTAQAEYISDIPENAMFNHLLEQLLRITESEYGFIGEVLYKGEAPYLKTHALTNIAWNDETKAFYKAHAPTGLEFYNLDTLFGVVLRAGTAVISNDPANDQRRGGLPPGHPPLKAFLGIPFYKGNKLVGMAGIANRPSGYDERMLEYLQPLQSTCANIITARRNELLRDEYEASLAQSLALNKAIIDALPDMVFIFEKDGRFSDIRSSHPETLYAPPHKAIGKNLKDILPEEVAVPAVELIKRTLDTGVLQTFNYELQLPGGLECFEARMVPLGGDKVLSTVKNVTEVVKIDQKKVELYDMLRHDIKSPLAVIQSNIESVVGKEMDKMESESVWMLGVASNSVQNIQKILDDMAAISKLESSRFELQKEPTDVYDMLLEASYMEAEQAKNKGLVFKRSVDKDLPFLIINKAFIMRSLTNLLQNAIKYTEQGGDVTLSARCVSDETGKYVSISVSDTGIGIPADEQEKVFDKHYRSRKTLDTKGSGLGLAIVKLAAEAHKGRALLSSEEGKGSTFTLLLPTDR